jgi:hypothetical protein
LRIIGGKKMDSDSKQNLLLQFTIICCGPVILHANSRSSAVLYEDVNLSTHQSSARASNCSRDDACCEVAQNRTKYSWASSLCGKLRFAKYMFICALYCLLRFPETSSAHGIIRSTNTGLPCAIARIGWGVCGLNAFWMPIIVGLRTESQNYDQTHPKTRFHPALRGLRNCSGDLLLELELLQRCSVYFPTLWTEWLTFMFFNRKYSGLRKQGSVLGQNVA